MNTDATARNSSEPDKAQPDAQPDKAQNDLEGTLLNALSLIESAVSRHRASSKPPVVELPFDLTGLRANAARLASEAQTDIACVIPASSFAEETLDLVLQTLAAATANGVRSRVVCTPESTETERGTRFLASLASSVDFRVAHCPLEELLIVDDRVALVRTTFSATRKMAVVQEPTVVKSLSVLFNCTWDLAGSAEETPRLPVPGKLSQRILGYLGNGYTDEAAARMLGISVRTYRRYVAQIMQNLGGTSRFQAGIRASQLGLVGQPCKS